MTERAPRSLPARIPAWRSGEELSMRGALEAWGRARWPDSRVMHELSTGGCRIDLAFVSPTHLAGIEIKSSRDTLERLPRQLEEFAACMPELWLATALQWSGPLHDHEHPKYIGLPWGVGHVVVDGGGVVHEKIKYAHWELPYGALVDPLLTVPMLHLCHCVELTRIAAAAGLAHRRRATRRDLMTLLARRLTGDAIIAGVCEQLRARQTGWAADAPVSIERAAA
jgi:hypothetical protein